MAQWERRKVNLGLASLALANSLTGGRTAMAADKIKPDVSSALIVVAVQNCFLPGGSLAVEDGDQVLWPDHCVQHTEGARLSKDLNIPNAELIIRKGFHNDVDSYSAFLEADKKTHTGLASYFRERGIKTVFVTGLATDFCVAWTNMAKAGVKKIQSSDLAA